MKIILIGQSAGKFRIGKPSTTIERATNRVEYTQACGSGEIGKPIRYSLFSNESLSASGNKRKMF